MGWHDERFTEDAKRVRFDCVSCARAMWFPRCKVGRYKTCGAPICKTARVAEVKSNRRRDCSTCGIEFFPRGTQLRRGDGLFCSQKCNRTGTIAMNLPEVQRRAKQTWRETFDRAPFIKSGPENPQWSGGRPATYRRRRDSGAFRNESNKRRSRTTDSLPKNAIPRLGELQRWKCAVCRKDIRRKFHLDHVTPLALGGRHLIGNVQLLCPPCNWSKNARDPVDFMQSRGFLL